MLKKIFALSVLLTLSFTSFCQTSTDEEKKVFTFVEEMPKFPGGDSAMFNFIAMNIRYPIEAMEKNISGKVFIGFVVDSTGNVTDTKVLRGVDIFNAEALRVVSAMPKWIPGKQNGKTVNVMYTIPIEFNITTPPSTRDTLPKGK